MSLTVSKQYRATVIFDTRGYDEPVDTLVEKVTELLTGLGAEIAKVDNLGHRDFVSGSTNRHAGDIYVTYDFDGDASVPAAIIEKTRLDKTVKRLQVFRR